ncbi:MAG: hypothetical protein ACLUDG_06520, partial [Butyricicoccus sp.]
LIYRELAAQLLHHFLLFCKPKIHAMKPPKSIFKISLLETIPTRCTAGDGPVHSQGDWRIQKTLPNEGVQYGILGVRL